MAPSNGARPTTLRESTLTAASVLFALAASLHGARRTVWSTAVRRMAEELREMGKVMGEEREKAR